MKRTATLLLLAWASQAAAQQSIEPTQEAPPYWADSRRGWHFYEDPAPPPKKPAPATPVAPVKPPELAALERLQEEVKTLRSIAVMNPTSNNVRRYMETEKRIAELASAFAEVTRRVAWTTPDLDPTLHGRPANAKALEVFQEEEQRARAGTIATLGKDHALFFFFRGDCPYCHAFAPTLAAFERRYGLRVVAVTLDGGVLPEYRNARMDNGISRTLNVSQVPALFLAQPYSGTIAPIGYGVLSESQLLERIATLATPVGSKTQFAAIPVPKDIP
ncbi:conjugal transfer protein TraF [Massilia sp. TS11]|uniref:conjugal transfer protein TraF n=1 Tax=Massilia sp. TS11 TaxID=2908003 RepID=UPI001EDA4FE3|nr:conjugal transfer protein TraF [Massilia sp. TS11]MCG2583879.1 conjugal transfer protein TraF [Massilia sp. TS11]